jgi:hypothetical protein
METSAPQAIALPLAGGSHSLDNGPGRVLFAQGRTSPFRGEGGKVWNQRNLVARADPGEGPQSTCAVTRRRFPVGVSPTRQPLQPEATGAGMEVTKCLKPSDNGRDFGDRASVQAAT